MFVAQTNQIRFTQTCSQLVDVVYARVRSKTTMYIEKMRIFSYTNDETKSETVNEKAKKYELPICTAKWY